MSRTTRVYNGPISDDAKVGRTLQSLLPHKGGKGKGISDPPILKDPVTVDDLWWFPPVQGKIHYTGSRDKFRYVAIKSRLP